MIYGVILVTRLPIHASKSLHGLDGNEIAAIFVLYLLILGADACLVVRRATDMGVPVYSAVVPSTGQTGLAIFLVLCVVGVLHEVTASLMGLI